MIMPEVPKRCVKTYNALAERAADYRAWPRGPWLSVWQLQHLTGQSSADVRARELRKLRLVDWRKAPGDKHGAVDYRIAAVPGQGREIFEDDEDQPCLSVSQMGPDASDGAGLLFDAPQDRDVLSRGKKATR